VASGPVVDIESGEGPAPIGTDVGRGVTGLEAS
jgi:hypothetical protein